jgi:hypothetical protein
MEFWFKVGLFTTGYLPLFFILSIKNWNSAIVGVLLLAVLIYNCIWLYYLAYPDSNKNPLRNMRTQHYATYIVDKVDRDDPPVSVYIIWYLIPFLNLTGSLWSEVLLVGILVGLFKLYTQSDLVSINPILILVGYKIHNILAREPCNSRGEEVLLITDKRRVDVNDQIDVDVINSDVYLDV